ncbi:MAG: hypothetical protein K1X57_12845 [Gemmataceae bacterium]|nr:hypothetical protein [Gemmataceae bacterium]
MIRLPTIPTQPAARVYLAMGAVSAALLAVCLAERGIGSSLILPPMAALAGLLFRWLAAPVFVLLGTAIALQIAPQPFRPSPMPLDDALLAGAIVGYVLAHYRMCAIAGTLYPADPRPTIRPTPRRRPGPPPWLEFLMIVTLVPYIVYSVTRGRRAGRPAPPAPEPRRADPPDDEYPRALMMIAACPLLAVGLWTLSARVPVPLRMFQGQWRIGLMVWLVLLAVLAVAAVTGYIALRRMSVLEARLRLHDTVWSETRAEQRSVARWVQWKRLRGNGVTSKP